MKTLNINWLGSCDNCGCTDILVNTEKGNENFLYEDDDTGVAFASWNEE